MMFSRCNTTTPMMILVVLFFGAVLHTFSTSTTTTDAFYMPSPTTTTSSSMTRTNVQDTPRTSLMMSATSSSDASAEAAAKSSSESNLKRLQELVIEHLALEANTKIVESTNFREDLGADSLDVIELVLSVEQEFDIDIDDDYASKIATVKDALDYLKTNHDINV